MPHTGSMTAGELVGVLSRSNPFLVFRSGRTSGYRTVTVMDFDGEAILNISRCGDLPPRTVVDSHGVIVCRGWIDTIALLYKSGYLYKTRELVRLLGDRALREIDRTGSPLIEQTMDMPGRAFLKDDPAPDWMSHEQRQETRNSHA